MTTTLPDISAAPELRPLAEVVRALYAAGGVTQRDCLLIGAAARDLSLRYAYGIDPGRATEDVDFAIAVADWEAFGALRQRLIVSGEFAARSGPADHRLRHRSGAPLDIVPFGGVERTDRTLAWPPEQKVVFDCFGLQEALNASIQNILAPEIDTEGAALLAHQSGIEIERARRLLLALSLELTDLITKHQP